MAGGISAPQVDRFVAKLQRDGNKENAAAAAAGRGSFAAAGTPAGKLFGSSKDIQG